jgi:carboxylate-amine ligase
MQSQIEIASPILTGIDDARERMNGLRQALAAALEPYELTLLAAGTHPLGVWREQNATEKKRYLKLVDDFQIIARRNLVCGLHVHVEIPGGVDRVRVMNRLMRWLPLFLALSTSSPFWDRQRTGLLGYRQSMYDEWPRTGIPDAFADETEYDAFAALLQRAGAIADANSLWWGIRPARRFPTLELRIADACTRLEDTLAIAAIYRCLVRRTVRDPEFGAERSALTRRVIEENRWRAKRWGLEAEFLHEHSDPTPVRDWLATLRDACRDDTHVLRADPAWDAADKILARGTSAHAQLALYHAQRREGATRAEALQAVVRWLLETTLARAG